MNTDNEYLWDKTGEPDPEIQQLEEILGTLRYQPRPLEIPQRIRLGREQSFFRDFGPRLAIAATIATLLVGLGLWLGLQRQQRRQEVQQTDVANKTPAVPSIPSPATVPSLNETPPNVKVSSGPSQKHTAESRRHIVNQALLAQNANRLRKGPANNSQLAVNERDGQAAKDQLMLALRMASAKLTFAHKKTQGTYPRDLIHNQHKIG